MAEDAPLEVAKSVASGLRDVQGNFERLVVGLHFLTVWVRARPLEPAATYERVLELAVQVSTMDPGVEARHLSGGEGFEEVFRRADHGLPDYRRFRSALDALEKKEYPLAVQVSGRFLFESLKEKASDADGFAEMVSAARQRVIARRTERTMQQRLDKVQGLRS